MSDVRQKAKIKIAVAAVLFLSVGYLLGTGQISLASLQSKDAGICKTFCEAIPATQYGFMRAINGVNHCFCTQEQKAYDFDNSRTLVWTQALDAGVIKAASVENGIPDAVRAQRDQQLLLQQQLLQQQSSGTTPAK